MFKPEEYMYVTIAVLPHQIAAVYALLGGASLAAVAVAEAPKAAPVTQDTGRASDGAKTFAQVSQASDGNGPTVTTDASLSDVDTGAPEVDAHGHAWSELLHAATKGTTKDGLWRMKVGVTRPAPMPGFPLEGSDTGTTTNGADTKPEPSAASTAVTETAAVQADTADDDEFAAFRNAAAEADKADEAAKATVPARKWTDADLGALCNAAAVKLGDPAPVKEIIGQFIPEGTVAHSRNIPEESREAFAKAVEAKAGIEFAG